MKKLRDQSEEDAIKAELRTLTEQTRKVREELWAMVARPNGGEMRALIRTHEEAKGRPQSERERVRGSAATDRRRKLPSKR